MPNEEVKPPMLVPLNIRTEHLSTHSKLAEPLGEQDSILHQLFHWNVAPSLHSVARPTPSRGGDHPCLEPGSYLPTHYQARWNLDPRRFCVR